MTPAEEIAHLKTLLAEALPYVEGYWREQYGQKGLNEEPIPKIRAALGLGPQEEA